MDKTYFPFIDHQVFWYLDKEVLPRLEHSLSVDVVIVGGGMAGLSAAQAFHEQGLSVALVEKSFCGSGASGKSSGFITPDSEYSFHNLVDHYGVERGMQLWEFVCSGVAFIEKNIKNYSIDCDYRIEDTLVVATTKSSFKKNIVQEYETRIKHGYATTLYTQETLPAVLGSKAYYGAVRYPDTFGISSFRYCQAMKKVLHKQGVQIFEETPVLKVNPHSVETPFGIITGKNIVVCVDRFLPELGKLKDEIYHVQTFLMISAPLNPEEAQKIFPQDPFMVWDTELIYNYFRLTADNRLLLGGAQLLSTYAAHEQYYNQAILKKLTRYFNEKFPTMNVTFEYLWPGLIGLSKDIIPIAGRDKNHPSLYYISGAAGLPWAAALGVYSADSIIKNATDLDPVFSPYRKFPIGSVVQKIIGKRAAFALSNFLTTRSL